MKLRRSLRLVSVCFGMIAIIAAGLLSTPATLAHAASSDAAVFVQTNDPAGNAIAAFRRHANGTLTFAALYPTGGKGGRESGAGSDPLASQGSLLFDSTHHLLFAVNAGSNTVSVFAIRGDTLHLNQVVASGGAFPVGFARAGSLLYVLNAGLAGDVSGFRIADGRLNSLKGSVRSLGLANASPPFFLSSPAQVGFTPSGSQLVVTMKTHGTVDVFSVNARGLPSSQPVKNAVGGVPFAFTFDAAGQLVLVSAANGLTNGAPNPGTGSVGTYAIHANDTVSPVSGPVTNGQSASCWITVVRGFDYVANTGSGTISQYRVGGSGMVALNNPTAASGIAGPTDLAAGSALYSQSGLSSSVEVFTVGLTGALTLIQTQAVPDGASQEGIVAL